jgi:hypothetical protein
MVTPLVVFFAIKNSYDGSHTALRAIIGHHMASSVADIATTSTKAGILPVGPTRSPTRWRQGTILLSFEILNRFALYMLPVLGLRLRSEYLAE